MIYPSNTNEKLGLNNLIAITQKQCLTESGKEVLSRLKFLTQLEDIDFAISLVDEMREILVLDYPFPLSHFAHQKQLIQKLKIEDQSIDLIDLIELKKFLDILRSVLNFFENEKHQRFKTLNKYLKRVKFHKYLTDRINNTVNSKGEIKDHASPELARLRSIMRKRKIEADKAVQQVYSRIKQSGWLDADISVTIVNGRVVVPIDSNHKRKINGMVHDVSATGKTSYIEPSEVLHINNELVDLEYQEKNEIERILLQISDDIRPYQEDINLSFKRLSVLDSIRAKAKLAIETESIRPAVCDEPKIQISNAKHPLLFLNFKKENREVVPLNIRLGEDDRMVLISGPNAGGKSVALKTVGLLQLMLQYGFLLPVGGATEMGIFSNIFLDMGDEQSLDNDLSTYSSHLNHMKYFVKNSHQRTLILIDEFGTGTEPNIGGAIAESVLESLNETGAYGVITTHYSNLKHFASSKEGLLNAAMMFDNRQMQPLFQIELGQAGSSFAFEIARKIGLPEEILQRASEKAGQEQIDFDKHLREVLRDKKYWNEKRQKIRKEEKRLDKLVEDLSSDAEQIKSLRKATIQEAKEEAKVIISTVNKKVENTIRDIRKAQAEKEKTKAIRKEFEDFKQEILEQKQAEREDKILRKIEKIKRQKSQQKQHQQKSKPNVKVSNVTPKELVPGVKVKLKNTNTYGELVELRGANSKITIGEMHLNVKTSRLEPVSNQEFKKRNPKPQSSGTQVYTDNYAKKLRFVAHLDVRGKRVDEALQLVGRFIDDAIATDTKSLKILHGTGTGALKVAIREYLSTIDLVESVKDEKLEMGGAGISVIQML